MKGPLGRSNMESINYMLIIKETLGIRRLIIHKPESLPYPSPPSMLPKLLLLSYEGKPRDQGTSADTTDGGFDKYGSKSLKMDFTVKLQIQFGLFILIKSLKIECLKYV